MIPIVFIHGFGGGSYEFQPIIKYLKKRGISKFYEFTYKENFGRISLRLIAKKFEKFVNKTVKEKKITIIGMSQGGIIARLFLKHQKQKKLINALHYALHIMDLLWAI